MVRMSGDRADRCDISSAEEAVQACKASPV